MNFVTRAKRDETEVAVRRTWRATDAPYLLIESVSKFGLPIAYYAIVVDSEGQQQMVSRHRTRAAAERACNQHARKANGQRKVKKAKASGSIRSGVTSRVSSRIQKARTSLKEES